jgi:hypothetical protein
VAVAVPVLVLLVVNVVVPHPLIEAVNDPANLNVGSNSAMVSGVVVSNGEFSAKMYEIDDDPSLTGFAITNLLSWKPGVGAVTCVDAVMDPLAAAMLVAEPSVTATVRVLRFAT